MLLVILYIEANVVSICVFVIDICGLWPGQPLQGVRRGATAFYTSSVNVWCSLGPNGVLSGLDGGAQGTMDMHFSAQACIYTWLVVCGHVAHWVPWGGETTGYRWVGGCSWRCTCRCVHSQCCLHTCVVTWSCRQ
jgi:hypothetical protein